MLKLYYSLSHCILCRLHYYTPSAIELLATRALTFNNTYILLLLLCIVVPAKLAPARLKKSTAQWFRLANSARMFTNLCWYYTKSQCTTVPNIPLFVPFVIAFLQHKNEQCRRHVLFLGRLYCTNARIMRWFCEG